MKLTKFKKMLLLILCSLLIAAMAVTVTGCGENDESTSSSGTVIYEDGDTVGNGNSRFSLTIVDDEEKSIKLTIKTDRQTVGEALTELKIISGEEGPYGLYIKTVNGKTFDYDKDKKYWAFYINGEYASKGIDQTEINTNTTYLLKVE